MQGPTARCRGMVRAAVDEPGANWALAVNAGSSQPLCRFILKHGCPGSPCRPATTRQGHRSQRRPRWRPRVRLLGPALLGSSLWIEDDGLIDKISDLYAACIVVKKQGRKLREVAKLAKLTELNKQTPGMPAEAFSALSGLAPKMDGKAVTVGPYDAYPYDGLIPTIRTLGFRHSGGNDSPPILHAKLALLGHLWWHDEGALGHVEHVVGFDARRLWISSANFTSSSRHNIEFGYWTEDPALIQGAERFLVRLMGSSEALDPDSDLLDPELAEAEFDDDAMAEALSEYPRDDEPDYWEQADRDYDD